MELVVKSDKLLLLEAIESGRASGLFDGFFIDKLRGEGVAMNINFAKKYYNAHIEPYLLVARDQVLGVCNLGLEIASQRDRIIASQLIRSHGLVWVFRQGFAAISKLSELMESMEEEPKKSKITEFFSWLEYEKGSPWNGYSWYVSELAKAKRRWEFLDLVQKLVGKNREDGHKSFVGKSLLMLVNDSGSDRLSFQELVEIEAAVHEMDDETLRLKLLGGYKRCGLHEHPALEQAIGELTALVRRLRESGEASKILLDEVLMGSSSDEIVRFEAEILRNSSKEELLDRLSIERNDSEDKSEIAKILLRFKLDADELALALGNTKDLADLESVMDWQNLGQTKLVQTIHGLHSQEQVTWLLLGWSKYRHEHYGKRGWEKKISEDLLEIISHCDADCVHKLSPYIHLSHEQALAYSDGYLPFLLKASEAFDFFWAGAGEEFRLFNILHDVLKEKPEAELCRRIEKTVRSLKRSFAKEGFEQDDPVFYDSAIRIALERSRARKVIDKLDKI